MSGRRRRVVAGASAVVVVALAVGGAVLSGSMSTTARRPLLDGLGPTVPYRWVEPPSWLASANREPTPGHFRLELTQRGSAANVFATGDLQVTIVAANGLIPPRPGAGRAVIDVEPLDPSGFPPPPDGLVAAGNVVRVRAAYEPGPTVRRFGDRAGDVVLVYPQIPTIHAEGHVVLASAGGGAWTRLATRDTPQLAQAEAPLQGPTDLLVAGRPKAAPTPSEGQGSGSALPIVLGVAALSALLLGAGILLRLRADR